MAKFLGFGNYEKEGPGVSKYAKEKRGFVRFFDVFFGNFTKIVSLSMIYFLFCIPIVTIGPATAGFTYVMRNIVSGKHTFLWMDFLDAFRSNFKQAFFMSIIDAIVIYIGVISFSYYIALQGIFSYIAIVITALVLLFFLFIRYYSYLIMVSIELSFFGILRNALNGAVLGLFPNLLATIILGVLSYLLIAFAYFLWPLGLIVLIVLIPVILLSLYGYIANFLAYPTFNRYILTPSLKAQHGLDPFGDEEIPEDDGSEQIFED